jgi:hypothetical protein
MALSPLVDGFKDTLLHDIDRRGAGRFGGNTVCLTRRESGPSISTSI